MTFHLGQPANTGLQRFLQRRHIGSGTGEQGRGTAVVLLDQCKQKMLRLDIRIILTDRHALGIGQRLLEPGCEFVKPHGIPLV